MTELVLTDRERRTIAGNRIKALPDVKLPQLSYWNYDPCPHHRGVGPQPDCPYRACGGDLFTHQRVGVSWLYAVRKGLLADDPGLGKTNQILALIALLKERGELHRRAVIIPQSAAVGQWAEECARWIPAMKTIMIDASKMTKAKRIAIYASEWDILIIGDRTAINDVEELTAIGPFDVVASDDVDPLLEHSNATHRAIRDISVNATRSFTLNATSLQIKLQQIHGALVPADGVDILGTLPRFEHRFVDTQYVTEFDEFGRKRSSRKAMGIKNSEELKEKLRGVYLRRKATELNDIRMPMIMPPQIEWLEMSQQQRIRYTELQDGVLRLMRDEGVEVKRVAAITKFNYGQQICTGLQALGEPDVPGNSPKLDRLFQRLDDVWSDRKVIVFAQNLGIVRAAIQRVQERDWDMALIWGEKQNKVQREEQKAKFWEDPNCRMIMGTKAIIRSHNLQVSNTVVGLDTPLNPATIRQFVGRAARAGSAHDRVWLYQFMMQDTQESRYWDILRRRQALYDVVFEDESQIFEALSPLELLQLVRP